MADPSAHRFFAQNLQVRYSMKMYREAFRDNKGRMARKTAAIFDCKCPYKNVGKFSESKNILSFKRNFPSSFSSPANADPDKNLAELQLKLFENEGRLNSARKRLAIKKKEVSQEWKDLEVKEKRLKEEFVAFNKFAIENKDKRIRARKKVADELQLVEQRQKDIDDLKMEIEHVQNVKETMDENIKDNSVYKTFLEKVLELGTDFNNINDIPRRFLSLEAEKKFLSAKQKESMNVLEHAKNSMMKLIEEKNFVIMGLNNQIANLQARYENANIKALESEELVTEIKNNAVKQLGEIESVKNSIWNVYVHMATSKKHPIKIRRDNVEEQMMYINRTLTELSKVNKLIKKRATKAK